MLDDLAVFEFEDVDDRTATASFFAHAVDMQDHIIAVGKYTLDLAVGVGEFFPQKTQKCLESFGPVRRRRIVLDIARPDKFRRGVKILLVERFLVEFNHGFLVGLLDRGISGERGRSQQHTDQANDNGSHGSYSGTS